MSRSGYGSDNAVMERFFSSLKHEWTRFESLADVEEARMSVFRYIETLSNAKRIHQTLAYKTPSELEAKHQLKLAV